MSLDTRRYMVNSAASSPTSYAYARHKRSHSWPAVVAALLAAFVTTAGASSVVLNPIQQLPLPTEGGSNYSIAVHGNFILVGRVPPSSRDPGIVLVYVKDSHCRGERCWFLKSEIHRPDAFGGDAFGASIAFDGKTLVVGSPNYGSAAEGAAAFVYKLEGDQFTAPQKLTGDPVPPVFDKFGFAVVVKNDQLAITDTMSKATYVFRRSSNGVWLHEARLQGEAIQYGISVDLSKRTLVVGSDVPGDADVFERDQRAWRKQQTLIPWDTTGGGFGVSVATDGKRIAVGAYCAPDCSGSACGAAYLFRELNGGWAPEEKLETPGNDSCGYFGWSVLIRDHRLAVMSRDGIYIFDRRNFAWINSAKLAGPNIFAVTDSFEPMGWDRSTLAAAGWTGVWIYDLSGIERSASGQ